MTTPGNPHDTTGGSPARSTRDHTGTRHHTGSRDTGTRGQTGTRGSTGTRRSRQLVERFADQAPAERRNWLLVDSLAVLVLLALAACAFRMTYGPGWIWVTGLGGAALGVGIGILCARFRLPTWLTAVATMAGYLVFGGLLAMPSTALGHVLPTPTTLSGLVFGVVLAWKQLLTIEAPIGETGTLLVVPLLTQVIAGVIAMSVALRSYRPTLAWIAPAVAVVIGIAFGVQTAWFPTVMAAVFAVVTLAWTAYRRDHLRQSLLGQQRTFQPRRLLAGVAVLLVAGGAAAAAAPVVGPSSARQVLRDEVVPPIDVRQYPSPLQGFRANHKDHKDDVLLRADGLPEGARIRVATLDSYDGITFNVSNAEDTGADSGTFNRVGTRVPGDADGETAEVSLTVADYASVWVPTVGETRQITFTSDRERELTENFFYNRASGTGVDTAGVRSGDSWTTEAVVPLIPSATDYKTADAGELELPDTEPVPDVLKERAQTWSEDAEGTGHALTLIQRELQKGYYSNGLEDDAESLSGHSVARLTELFTAEAMVGDEEQYAVAFALMARELGVPSRVVYGYLPSSAGAVEITGGDVSAWVEVNLEGFGWVPMDAAPDKSRTTPPDNTPQESKPRPQVENPPPPPDLPEEPPPDNTPPDDPEQEDDDSGINWQLVFTIAGAIGIPLLLLLGPVAVIVGIKARRRVLRMRAARAAARISGGWTEVVDRARDFGVQPRAAQTRTETAALLSERFGEATDGRPPDQLARAADAYVFAPSDPSQEQVDHFWSGVDQVVAGMRSSSTRWQRFRAKVSLQSFRPLK
ncbi:MAG: transglutaminaseTgpA domain-containing protein [Propionibacteriaceae bacterium]